MSHFSLSLSLSHTLSLQSIPNPNPNHRFSLALEGQPQWELLSHDGFRVFGYALVVVGGLFVLTSMYQLGITGTYLGDYFGILMEEKVVSFPFNVLDDPMYDGASMIFLGQSLM